jgi:hypothetical protein
MMNGTISKQPGKGSWESIQRKGIKAASALAILGMTAANNAEARGSFGGFHLFIPLSIPLVWYAPQPPAPVVAVQTTDVQPVVAPAQQQGSYLWCRRIYNPQIANYEYLRVGDPIPAGAYLADNYVYGFNNAGKLAYYLPVGQQQPQPAPRPAVTPPVVQPQPAEVKTQAVAAATAPAANATDSFAQAIQKLEAENARLKAETNEVIQLQRENATLKAEEKKVEELQKANANLEGVLRIETGGPVGPTTPTNSVPAGAASPTNNPPTTLEPNGITDEQLDRINAMLDQIKGIVKTIPTTVPSPTNQPAK